MSVQRSSIPRLGEIEKAIESDLTPDEIRAKDAAELNAFVEFYFNQMDSLPSLDRLKVEFPRIPKTDLKARLQVAAIKLNAKGYNLSNREWLTPEQLAVANSILNLADKRSLTKKLQDFGVSAATFGNWKKNPSFNAYLRERSEDALGAAIPDVHLALIDAATNGDTTAIKLFYEITGRHTPGSRQDVNVQATLVHVIEAVQKHVQDPKVLQAIANDIQSALGSITGVVQGEIA